MPVKSKRRCDDEMESFFFNNDQEIKSIFTSHFYFRKRKQSYCNRIHNPLVSDLSFNLKYYDSNTLTYLYITFKRIRTNYKSIYVINTLYIINRL